MPAKKDPNKPRGRMSGYAYFVQTCREEHKRKHPNEQVVFAEFSRKCARRWKDMNDKEKKPFNDLTEMDRQRYEREMKEYRLTNMGMEGGRGTKRPKKKKDPNAPKRPQSAFFLFCADHRGPLKQANPSFTVGDIAKALGKKWAEAGPDVKQKYSEQGEKEKAKYNKAMDAYRNTQGAMGGAATGPSQPKKQKMAPVPVAHAPSSSDDSDSESEGDSD